MVTFPNAMGCHQVSYVVYVLFASMSIYNEIRCGAMPRCLQKKQYNCDTCNSYPRSSLPTYFAVCEKSKIYPSYFALTVLLWI